MKNAAITMSCVISIVFALALQCHGQVTSNALRRVLLIRTDGQEGTAFTIEVDGRQYMVTAKHVIASVQDGAETTISVLRKDGFRPLKVRVFKCDAPVDIAVLIPPAQITVNYKLDPTSKGMMDGQDAYFVGFPYGESMAITYENMPDVFALVKHATVAGFKSHPEKRTQLIELDGYNNPGFSGSPVVFHDQSDPPFTYKVAGVVSSFMYEATRIVKKERELQATEVTPRELESGDVVVTITDGKYYRVKDTDELVKLNTGIAMAWDIGSAVDLIKKHPIGPIANDDFTGLEPQVAH